MDPKNFFAELKRRNVYKVAVAYAVVGWLIIQIATAVFPVLQIPSWAIRLVVVLVLLGFPLALVLAWAFELTPEGIRRPTDANQPSPRSLRAAAIATWLFKVNYLGPEQIRLTPALLRLDPVWNPVRQDPQFQELCDGKEP